MTLFSQSSSPLEDTWVALDLETTGLSPDDHGIIEVGAAKFEGHNVLDIYQTFVNPNRRLDGFIKEYTGITQADVDGAPPFSAVAGRLASFIGSTPIVGHNIAFDLGFLDKNGLRLTNPRCDTWDIAFVLLPELRDYSLAGLAGQLDITHPRPHRAVDDALITKELFLRLGEMLEEQDAHVLAEMQRLSGRSSWVLSYLFGRLSARDSAKPSLNDIRAEKDGTSLSLAGYDAGAVAKRLKHGKPLRPKRDVSVLDVDFVASLLEDAGPVSETMPGFEERSEQVEMARRVASAINEGGRLIVEAGTGVGKSLAYLIPAALYALANDRRVVVSTNTINLQEQLLKKDLPAVVSALAELEDVSADDFKYAQLKGRGNYLCLRRWAHLRSSESLSDSESRLLAKTHVWLQKTATGDRSELNLGRRSVAAPWDRMSAQGAVECPRMAGPCFLKSARDKAAAAHVLIVNHALLLSDLAAGGSVIPDYDVLIIDEAHHLEDEATRHLGFDLGHAGFDDHLQSLSADRGLLNSAVNAFRGSSAAATRRRSVEESASKIAEVVPSARDNAARLFSILQVVLGNTAESGSEDLRITSATRAQPDWSELEVQWENVDSSLSELGQGLSRLQGALEGLEEAGLVGYDGLLAELGGVQQTNVELRQRLAEFVPHPKPDGIYWVTRRAQTRDLTMHAAPLHVGETLDKMLFSRKDCVVMTSATLSANESFHHICDRTGFADAEELLLGSPFDYPRSALLCVPEDMPEPNSSAYQPAVDQAVRDATLAVGGQTMALFTSYASLQATAEAIRPDLKARGISVLAQGTDGSPAQIVRRFLDEPNSVLLGTSSFWEGVDLAGESLRVLLVTRLPFNVPTDPVFATRSELYEEPFAEYGVPQAILRLRQGFGRLIRTNADRGVAVILDRRIVSRRYGEGFLKSLPPATFKTCRRAGLAGEIRGWLGG